MILCQTWYHFMFYEIQKYFTQFIRDKLKILKMQHINYIVKIRKREADFELRQQWSSGECRAQFENC